MAITPLNIPISGTVAADGTATITIKPVIASLWSMVMVGIRQLVAGQAAGNPSWSLGATAGNIKFALGAQVELGPHPYAPGEVLVISLTNGIPGASLVGVIHGVAAPTSDELLSGAYTPSSNSVSTLTSPAPDPFTVPNQSPAVVATTTLAPGTAQWIVNPPINSQQIALINLDVNYIVVSIAAGAFVSIGHGTALPVNDTQGFDSSALLYYSGATVNDAPQVSFFGQTLAVGHGVWVYVGAANVGNKTIVASLYYSLVPGSVIIAVGPPTTISLTQGIATVDVTDRSTRQVGIVSMNGSTPAAWQRRAVDGQSAVANVSPGAASITISAQGAGISTIINTGQFTLDNRSGGPSVQGIRIWDGASGSTLIWFSALQCAAGTIAYGNVFPGSFVTGSPNTQMVLDFSGGAVNINESIFVNWYKSQ